MTSLGLEVSSAHATPPYVRMANERLARAILRYRTRTAAEQACNSAFQQCLEDNLGEPGGASCCEEELALCLEAVDAM